jgi:hypothetical protein
MTFTGAIVLCGPAWRACATRWMCRRDTPITLSAKATKRFPAPDLALRHKTRWQRMEVRFAERGVLVAEFALERVWPPNQEGQLENLWLVMRREANGKLTFTLLNDPPDTPREVLVKAACQRHFVECVFDEAKSELGWADFCARKYLAWEHHTALTAAALWFIAGVKLNCRQNHEGDRRLNKKSKVPKSPFRTLARARLALVWPLRAMLSSRFPFT